MQRYVLTALSIGVGAAVIVIIAISLGAFSAMATWLEEVYLSRGILDYAEGARFVWLEMLIVLFVSVGLAWCVIDVSQIGQKVLVFGCLCLMILGLSPTLALYGFLFEPFSSLTGGFLAGAAGFVFAGTERGMRKRILQDVLGLRVSNKTFNELLNAPEPPDFEGAVREVTVLTCRIFNHGELREKLESAELMKMSNLFLRSVSTFLTSRGAYLDESGPELVRVFFGMLRPTDDHAEQACRAALELRSRLKTLNQECETRWFQPLHYGIGVNSGPMTVGVYGSREHYYYSGIGAQTDYSRRLAHANLRYSSDLLIGPETFYQVQSTFEVRPMEMFYDPEEELMTEIYQLLAAKDNFTDEDRSRRDQFWQGVIYLREKRYEEALEIFSKVRIPGGDDAPAEFFLTQAQEGAASTGEGQSGQTEELTENGHARLISQM
tara:strand:+ start:537 stop:1844 length:1308 start_codon:yes stop_codon:yes gene_type:complete